MQHHAGDGIQRVACRFAGVVVVQQLCHDLGVGLRDKAKAFVEQTVLDLLIVFNDAVVHHGNLLVTGIMRCALTTDGSPWVAQRVWPMPQLPCTALPPSVISL